MAKFNVDSAPYKLLAEMSQKKDFIEFRGRIYIPVTSTQNSVWGLIEVDCFQEKPTNVQIKKAVQAVKDILEANLDSVNKSEDLNEENYSFLMLESSFEKSHRTSTSIFQDDNFTSLINLSEWINQKQPFSLSSLREFSDSLLFIPEVLDLTANQRAILALFALLPQELKKSSLIVCTKLNAQELTKEFNEEKNFLEAFSDKKKIQENNVHSTLFNQ